MRTISISFLVAILLSPIAGSFLAQEASGPTPPATIKPEEDSDPASCSDRLVQDLNTTKSLELRSRRSGDPSGELRALIEIVSVYTDAGRYKQAQPYLARALTLSHELGRVSDEAWLKAEQGDAYNHVGQSRKALDVVNDALRIATEVGDKRVEAVILKVLGEIYWNINSQKAMEALQQGLTLSEEAGDLKTQAIILNDEGAVLDSSDRDQAFHAYERALLIEEQIGDCRDQTSTLTNIGLHYEEVGEARNAINGYERALKLALQFGDQEAQAPIHHNMGLFYEDVGDFAKALSHYEEALGIERRIGDAASEGPTLGAIAGIYKEEGKLNTARIAYHTALSVLQKTGDLRWQIIVFNALGSVEADLGHRLNARAYYDRAMKLAATVGDAVRPAYSAWGIGQLEERDAVSSYIRALCRAQEFNLPELEGLVDESLMAHFEKSEQPELAIFFGKQAVDKFQTIRGNLSGLGDGFVSSFLESKANAYRLLAQLLIDDGRLTEAQQILDLLKLQEYSDYIRGKTTDLRQNPTRTVKEAAFEKQYLAETSNLVQLSKQLKELDDEHRSVQDPEYVRISGALKKAEADFTLYLHNLYLKRQGNPDANNAIRALNEETSRLQDVVAREPHTVALYTLMGEDEYRVIVVTENQKFWRSYPIGRKALATKCYQFLELLSERQPGYESAARELFKIVFAPVQKDVEQSGATTLVWYLDGALRYLPVSALLDPETGRYLIDSYATVNYTPLNFFLADPVHLSNPSAIAMGTSRSYETALGPLPNVRNELDHIVKDPSRPESQGILPGTILLDGQFTQAAMESDVADQSIVHIASHFVLVPGNDDLSYLLLGGKDQDSLGFHLSVSDFRHDKRLHIDGKELITLSACRTAAANIKRDGFEMEGVSEAVLDKRAKAVISSLWEVNDQSTGALMSDFYQLWIGSSGNTTKAQALRQSEIDLLHGKIVPENDLSNISGPSNFSHPYYWAPFVLMGNWH